MTAVRFGAAGCGPGRPSGCEFSDFVTGPAMPFTPLDDVSVQAEILHSRDLSMTHHAPIRWFLDPRLRGDDNRGWGALGAPHRRARAFQDLTEPCARRPLPWGEVGPQARVRGFGLSWIRMTRHPSPQPSPHGRGGGYGRFRLILKRPNPSSGRSMWSVALRLAPLSPLEGKRSRLRETEGGMRQVRNKRRHPPLSAKPTSPPQGGRGEQAARPRKPLRLSANCGARA